MYVHFRRQSKHLMRRGRRHRNKNMIRHARKISVKSKHYKRLYRRTIKSIARLRRRVRRRVNRRRGKTRVRTTTHVKTHRRKGKVVGKTITKRRIVYRKKRNGKIKVI